MTDPQPKKSDLGVRVASAVVMIAVAGTALWLGGWVWTLFVAVVALGVLWEWWGLVRAFVASLAGRALWLIGGVFYIGIAAWILVRLREFGSVIVLFPLLAVVATDIGAYFVGRAVGGPKIAPRISPSKTWSGLCGGILFAAFAYYAADGFSCWDFSKNSVPWLECKQLQGNRGIFEALGLGTVLAVVAQIGDFFESWMKRRSGVKDSGTLIPGHGGLFDRVDGLIAVLFALGILVLAGSTLDL